MRTTRALILMLIAQTGFMVAQTPSPSVIGSGKGRFETAIDRVLTQGEGIQMEGETLKLLGLVDATGHWSCKSISKTRKSDQSAHQMAVSNDGNGYVMINFRTVGDKRSITWRTNAAGELLLTTYSEAGATNIVSNSKYAAQFEEEKAIWNKLLGESATPTASATPSK